MPLQPMFHSGAASTAAAPADARRFWALREIPPFPALAMKLAAALSDANAPLKDLIDLLRSDVAFSAELLRRANSPLYGLRMRVSSLQHAVAVLGFDQIRAIALALSAGTYIKPVLRMAPLRMCWRHTLATAVIAEEMARACSLEPDRAYTAGLLHDIGLLGLMVGYPAEYVNLLAVSQEQGFSLLDAERAAFELDHCEAGGFLAQEWSLPAEIADAARLHHGAPAAGPAGVLAIVCHASLLADALGFEVFLSGRPPELDQALRRLPEAATLHLGAEPDALRGRVLEKLAVLE